MSDYDSDSCYPVYKDDDDYYELPPPQPGRTSLGPVSFLWVIPNYHKYVSYNAIEPPASGSITSEIINIFELWLYPRGDEIKNKDYVSITICQKKFSDLKCAIKISLLSEKNEKMYEMFARPQILEHNVAYKMPKFIKVDVLMDKNNKYLPNGSLNIQFEIYPNKYEFVQEQLLKLSGCSNDYEKLVNDENSSDIIFIVENKKIHAHKIILIARSPVFQAMFTHNMMEARENTVTIEDINYQVFLEFLRFLYCGKINEIEKNGQDLLIVANRYSVKGLQNVCELFLYEDLTIENAHEYLVFADSNNLFIFKSQIMKFIIIKSKKFKDSDILKFTNSHPDLSKELAQEQEKGKSVILNCDW